MSRKNISHITSIIHFITLVIMIVLSSCKTKHTTLTRGNFKTTIVKKGNIETLVSAEGTAQPSSKVIILSPASCIVKNIYKEPGQIVKKGDIIVTLDTKNIKNDIDILNDQLKVKYNNLEKNRLSASSTKADLAYNSETKKLRIASIKSTITDQKQLFDVGGISQANLEKTQQELVLAEKDLKLTKNKNNIRLAQLATEEKGMLLQISMQEKELVQKQNLLKQMVVKAPSNGIILNTEAKEGEKIQGESLLISMSNLSRLKISASIKSKNKDIIKVGKQAYVVTNGKYISGHIGSVAPQIDNGRLHFSIYFSKDKQTNWIPNQKVDIMIVKEGRYNINKIALGNFIKNEKESELLVIKGDSAIRKKVTFGSMNNKYIEIIKGLKEGDIVITSSKFRLNTQPSYYIKNN